MVCTNCYKRWSLVFHLSLFLTLTFFCSCRANNSYTGLQDALDEYVKGKEAEIGVAVIIDGVDTVAVNGNKDFPMLSVYKFPIALALGEYYRQNNLNIDTPVVILKDDLHVDTYSPMTEKILASSEVMTDSLTMPTMELLGYMLQQSDNNASDIALRKVNGAAYVEQYLNIIGAGGVNVRNSEAEMHADNSLCYANSSTPVAMAALIDRFDREHNDSISLAIKNLMETCETGVDRLAKPLEGAVVGHKTGTGFSLPDGRLMAVNDVGYVHLPDGHRYTIAVFIANSAYSMAETEALIAGISEITLRHIKNTQ